ncbi:MAG: ABC transporter ATP-binding protein [Planctomycetota bacterium]|nr:MAG: ABC transporter ATP-binding protein [Planctomycetota bacterium]
MIEIQNLTKIYRTGFWLKPKTGIQNLNLQIEHNQVVGFLGINGAGKTTTIKILVGLLKPTSGSAYIDGKNILLPESRQEVGYLPEAPYFYEYLTPNEILTFYGQLFHIPRQELKKRIGELLELVQLQHAQHTFIRNFSKGMRQRLGIAQALISHPKIVILDEPTSGLDPLGRKMVKDIIIQLKEQGKTIFFSSHILPDVEAICDRVALIHQGKLLKEGFVDELVGDQPASIEIVAQNIQPENYQNLAYKILQDKHNFYLFVHNEQQKEQLQEKIVQNGGKIRFIIPHKPSLEEYFKNFENPEK